MILQFFTATAAITTPAPAPSGRHKAAATKPQQHLHKWLQHVLPALLQALLTCARLLAGTAAAGGSSSILRSVKDQAAADKVSLQESLCRQWLSMCCLSGSWLAGLAACRIQLSFLTR
jgi:hypothetical protein